MRANWEIGISVIVRALELTGASTSSRRSGAVDEAASTRGLRADWSVCGSGESETNCSVICRFGVNSASAALRALVSRWGSSPRGCDSCCHRLSKSCSGRVTHSRGRKEEILTRWTWEAGHLSASSIISYPDPRVACSRKSCPLLHQIFVSENINRISGLGLQTGVGSTLEPVSAIRCPYQHRSERRPVAICAIENDHLPIVDRGHVGARSGRQQRERLGPAGRRSPQFGEAEPSVASLGETPLNQEQ